MRNFEEYRQEYIKTHPIPKNNNKIQSRRSFNYLINFKKFFFYLQPLKIIKNYSILLIPIIFTFVIDLSISPNKKNDSILNFEELQFSQNNYFNEMDSTRINRVYSEKSIESIDIPKPSIFSLSNHMRLSNLNISFKNNKKNNIEINKEYSKINDLDLLDLSLSKWEKNYSKKKVNFIKTLLPIIAYQNQKILIERNKLFEIKKYIQINKTLTSDDIEYLKIISSKYLINLNNKHKIDLIEELLVSVNIIPNSIVLAQAANESGWGTSRFAKEHNALFGEYTYNQKIGVIPYEREEGKKHLIKNFKSIDKSVESYFFNINTHSAYLKFRTTRNGIHDNEIKNSIKLLTKTLEAYAEDKFYVKTLNSIIDANELNQFDSIILSFIKS